MQFTRGLLPKIWDLFQINGWNSGTWLILPYRLFPRLSVQSLSIYQVSFCPMPFLSHELFQQFCMDLPFILSWTSVPRSPILLLPPRTAKLECVLHTRTFSVSIQDSKTTARGASSSAGGQQHEAMTYTAKTGTVNSKI